MDAAGLTGIALDAADPSEVAGAIDTAVAAAVHRSHTRDGEDLMAAAIHAVGHLARRFGAVDAALLDRVVTAASGFGRSRRVAGALYDMRDDIGHFIPESPPAVPSVRDGTCRDGPG